MLAKLSSKLRIVLTLAMVAYFKKDKSTKRYNDDQSEPFVQAGLGNLQINVARCDRKYLPLVPAHLRFSILLLDELGSRGI